jgi:hypothetical protein
MLKDGMYYEETDKKADQKTYKMITKLLHEHEGELHFKNSRSSLIKLGTSQHSGLSIMSIK